MLIDGKLGVLDYSNVDKIARENEKDKNSGKSRGRKSNRRKEKTDVKPFTREEVET